MKYIKYPLLAILFICSMNVAFLSAKAIAEAEEPGQSVNPLLGRNTVKKPSVGGELQLLRKDGVLTLCDQNGEPIQLRGMSTHGLQWHPDIVNDNAFAALSRDWEANVIRLAMYVGESGGYASNPSLKDTVIQGIDYAIANDLYVIVDWHVHVPGDPRDRTYAGAMDFFKDIAARYPNDPHILYELANEPNSNPPGIPNDASGWAAVKSYAEPIIRMLRSNGNDNIVLVGSPNWSQRPDLAADDPIDDDRTMYTVHFYTGSHPPAAGSSDRNNVMSNARYALEHGVAIFASEWGTSEANGNNGPYLKEADQWLEFLNRSNVSWVNWSLTNKNETSAAFTPFELGWAKATTLDPGSVKAWSIPELSASGEYVRARIKGIAYKPIARSPRKDMTRASAVVNQPISFDDVDDRLAPFVLYLAERDIVHGVGNRRFAPDEAITRAEFVQLLAKLYGGVVHTKARTGFSDVTPNDWYNGAAWWAAQNGLIQGEAGRFNPNASLTRQDLAVILHRFANRFAPGVLNRIEAATLFDDEYEIAEYAADAVASLRVAGIVTGRPGNRFDPAASTTRGEAAEWLALLVQAGS